LPSVGLPTILRGGDRNPFECILKYSLIPRDNETERTFLTRLMQEHNRNRVALLAAARNALASRKIHPAETLSLSSFKDHVKWTAWFQLCDFEITEILKRTHADVEAIKVDVEAIKKGINSVLRRIMLTRRRSHTIGRPRKIGKSQR
jgi:hypothetical protein